MGYMHKVFLSGKGVYGCSSCETHLAKRDDITSRHYTGQYGRAVLLSNVVNVIYGEEEKRAMTTGVHIVRDVSCMGCKKYVGWTYIKAYVPEQRFKEGQFILEREIIHDVSRDWDY
ncbi:Yippee/Mis18 [Coemansia spiralis]|nr:Yippee/Mis18 [Coemansia spiralis]